MGFEQRKKWEQSCLEMHIYRVYKSVVYYRTLSGIPPQFSAKALAISAVLPALKVIPRKSYKL